MSDQVTYTRITAKDKNDYICPMELVKAKQTLGINDLDDCVEAEVVGRYIGNIEIADGV